MESKEIHAIAYLSRNLALYELDSYTLEYGSLGTRTHSLREYMDGHAVIMGRHTYEELESPIHGTMQIVLTSNKALQPKERNTFVAHSMAEALHLANRTLTNRVFILGGAHVFEATSDMWTHMHLRIDTSFHNGDHMFPAIEWRDWNVWNDRWEDFMRCEGIPSPSHRPIMFRRRRRPAPKYEKWMLV